MDSTVIMIDANVRSIRCSADRISYLSPSTINSEVRIGHVNHRYIVKVVDGKDWCETVGDPEVKSSTEGPWFVMRLAVTRWIVMFPTTEEMSVSDSKAGSSKFSLSPEFDRMGLGGLEVVEVYLSVLAVEITSTVIT